MYVWIMDWAWLSICWFFLLDLPASIHQAKNKQMENDCQFCRDVLSVQDANVCMVSAKHYKCFVFARPWKHYFFFVSAR